MSNIEGLKEQARRHEQKEEWRKALDQYNRAIDRLAEEDTPDIGLYNRVGDLFIRVGDVDQAVGAFEKAVELYVDSELPNNAIAVCKKILRSVPDRAEVFLRMGRIRADQGFVVDARSHFITYAERTQAAGDLDEALRALVEFADTARDDTEIRMAIASHFQQHERTDEAVEQLIEGYRSAVRQGLEEEVSAFEERLSELRPGVDPAILAEADEGFEATEVFEATEGAEATEVDGDDFAIESTSLAADPDDGYPGSHAGVAEAMEDQVGEALVESVEDLDSATGWQADDAQPPAHDRAVVEGHQPFDVFEDSEDQDAEGADDLGLELAADEPGEGEGADDEPPLGESLDDAISSIGPDVSGFEPASDDVNPLQGFDLVSSDDGEEAGDEHVDLPLTLYHDDEDEDDDGPVDLPLLHEPDASSGVDEGEWRVPTAAETDDVDDDVDDAGRLAARIADAPDDLDLRQRAVELAHRSGDDGALAAAYVGLGEALRRSGAEIRAQAVFRQALQLEPDHREARNALDGVEDAARPVAEVASNEDYVDLGALILGDEDEKTTRFVVAYEEPSGDEQADFAKMLTQFKAKVAENVDADDVKAHHDLGTAYKEMGLLDEAVEEFQAALRASADHLPTYEMLGQTFLDGDTPQAAVRVLTRALEVPFEVEDELLGIYYSLGRSHEVLGNTEQAREFYERVFSLDINFADVTERLRALR